MPTAKCSWVATTLGADVGATADGSGWRVEPAMGGAQWCAVGSCLQCPQVATGADRHLRAVRDTIRSGSD
eukprot:2829675-Prymnesium_polylepis.1